MILPDPARRLAAGFPSYARRHKVDSAGVSSMRLAQFITRNIETILEQWEAFAATRLPAAEHMKPLELHDVGLAIRPSSSLPLTPEPSRGADPDLWTIPRAAFPRF